MKSWKKFQLQVGKILHLIRKNQNNLYYYENNEKLKLFTL